MSTTLSENWKNLIGSNRKRNKIITTAAFDVFNGSDGQKSAYPKMEDGGLLESPVIAIDTERKILRLFHGVPEQPKHKVRPFALQVFTTPKGLKVVSDFALTAPDRTSAICSAWSYNKNGLLQRIAMGFRIPEIKKRVTLTRFDVPDYFELYYDSDEVSQTKHPQYEEIITKFGLDGKTKVKAGIEFFENSEVFEVIKPNAHIRLGMLEEGSEKGDVISHDLPLRITSAQHLLRVVTANSTLIKHYL